MQRRLLAISSLALLMSGAATAALAQEAAVGLEEVIVTANRRSEDVQRSSLAIAVVGGRELATKGVSQPTDLQNVVPGLSVSFGGAAVNTFVRGVGTFGTDANAEGAIAYNINGVYISRLNGIGPIFYDLERVEVLKGPQGTLYGRNASGGAINLITTKPTREWGADVSGEYGNYDHKRFTGSVNMPVTDTLAFRLAGQFTDRDGYLSDGYDDQKTQAIRLTGLWRPNDRVSLLATGEYTRLGGKGAGIVKRSTLTASPSDPWIGASEPGSQPQTAALGGTRITDDGTLDTTIFAASAELNWDLGFANLTFIPAYRRAEPATRTYTPGFLFVTEETSGQQSYELRLSKQTDRLKWVAGLYYFDEDQTQHYELYAIPIQRNSVFTTLGTRSWAAFGEATYSLTDKLRLIAGGRYSEDRKSQDGTSIAALPNTATVNNFGRRNFSSTNWKAGIEYDVGTQSMLFATAATGYKAGGFFPSVPYPANSFEPEKLTAYTLGSRNRFLGNRLQVNLEGFYWDYKNKQERFLGATTSGTTGLFTTNAGTATLYGVDLEVQFKPTANDTFRVSAEYLKSKYDDFRYTAYNPPPLGLTFGYAAQATGCSRGANTPFLPNNPFVPTDATQGIDCSGQPLVRAPKWSGSAGYEHSFRFGNGAELVAGADLQFATSQYLTADFIDSSRDDGFVMVDANLTYLAPGGRWSVQGWVRNITKEAVYTGGFRYPFSFPAAIGGDPSLAYLNIRPPRTYGVTLRASF
jgi:iron complex outermembrane receptor protein